MPLVLSVMPGVEDVWFLGSRSLHSRWEDSHCAHLFNEHFLSTYCIPEAVLDSGDTKTIRQDRCPGLQGRQTN